MRVFIPLIALLSLSTYSSGQGVKPYIELSEYFMHRQPDSARSYAMLVMEKAPDSNSFYHGLYLRAQYLHLQGYTDSAKNYYQDVITYCEHAGDTPLKMRASLGRAGLLKLESNFEEALGLVFQALKYAKKMEDRQWQAHCHVALAEMYRALGNYEKGLGSIHDALTLNEKYGLSDELMARVYHRWAPLSIHNEKDGPEVRYSNQSLMYSERCGDLHAQAVSHNELGVYYSRAGASRDLGGKKAEYHLRTADSIWSFLGFGQYQLHVQQHLATRLRTLERFDESIQVFKQGLVLAASRNWHDAAMTACNELRILYDMLGNVDSAYHYVNLGNGYGQIYHLETQSEALQRLQVEYETELKDQKLNEQEKDVQYSRKQAQAKTRERNIVLVSAVVLFLSLLLVTVLSIRLRKKNRQLMHSRERIAGINQQLEKSLEQKEALFAELHHRVKNNLGILSGLLYLQSEQTTDELAKAVLSESRQRVHSIALVHQSLYQMNEASEIDFSEYIGELVASLYSTFGEKVRDVQCRIEGDAVQLDISQAVPLALIINELVTNSFKYAFPSGEGELVIEMKVLQEGIRLMVGDSGPGLPEGFDLESTGTLGLKLVRILSRQLQADMKYEDGRFTFNLASQEVLEEYQAN